MTSRETQAMLDAGTMKIKDGYERRDCAPCKGTGKVPKGAANGYYTWKSDRRKKPNCNECMGWGFTVHQKLPESVDPAGVLREDGT